MQTIRDPRILIFIGLFMVEICLFMMTFFSSLTSEHDILYMLFARGVALAFLFIPINSTILSQFSGFELGQVAGLLNLFRQIGGSIGIALIGTLLARNTNYNYNQLISHVTSLNQNAMNTYNSTVIRFSNTFIKDIGLTNTATAAIARIISKKSTSLIQSFSKFFLLLYFLALHLKIKFVHQKKK
ncbi:hypothetical protein [Silvanigrella sp.]|uniref:hypothetical protein n=1 Tax=Silvanigrella sp. TaxID=2024976 RepID=UPI0037CBE4EA